MAFKRVFVDIQGDLLDCWNIISVEREDEYNEVRGEMDYLLIVLKNSVNKEAEKKIYKFADQDERDNLTLDIKEKLKNNPNIYFLGEDDGSINDDLMHEMGFTKKQYKHTKDEEDDE